MTTGRLGCHSDESGANVSIYLVLNARDASSADPVVDQGNGVRLLVPGVILGPVNFADLPRHALTSELILPIAVPDDSGLVGVVMLFQYLAVIDGTPLVSDVFGGPIVAGPPAQEALHVTSRGAGTAATAQRAAIRDWMESFPQLPTAERRMVLTWLQTAGARGTK